MLRSEEAKALDSLVMLGMLAGLLLMLMGGLEIRAFREKML